MKLVEVLCKRLTSIFSARRQGSNCCVRLVQDVRERCCAWPTTYGTLKLRKAKVWTAQIVADLRIECSVTCLYKMSTAVNQMLKFSQSGNQNQGVLSSDPLVVVNVRSDREVLHAWAVGSEKEVAGRRKSLVISRDI